MNPVKFLKHQHREVESLFSEIEKTGEKAVKRREQLAAELIEKLTIHAKLEETIFYPRSEKVDEDLTLESYEEHALVKFMLRKLGKTSGSDEMFLARVTVLKEVIQHHVEEEEKELFPECEKKFNEAEFEAIGARLEAAYEKLSAAQSAAA